MSPALDPLITLLKRNIPGHVIIDDAGIITSLGPLAERLFSTDCVGKQLINVFLIETQNGQSVADFIAYTGSLVFRDITATATATAYLEGYVWPFEGGAILALGLNSAVSELATINASLDDYAKTPPSAVSFFRRNMLEAMKEEAAELAALENFQRLRADAALSEIRQFSAVTCHDVINYHGIIGGSLKLIIAATDFEKIKLLSIDAMAACDRASTLLRASMHLSEHRREAIAGFYVDDAVLEVESLLRSLLTASVELRLKLFSPNAQVVGSKSGFIASLINLVKNSAESIGDDDGVVSVRTRIVNSGNLKVVISVEDTGPSCAPFEIHKRLEGRHLSRKHGAISLGLESVRRFCESYEWDYQVTHLKPSGVKVQLSSRADIIVPDSFSPSSEDL